MSELMKCLDYVIDLSLDSAVQSWKQKPFTIQDTTILMPSASEIVDTIKEEISYLQRACLANSDYYKGKNIIVLMENNLPSNPKSI